MNKHSHQLNAAVVDDHFSTRDGFRNVLRKINYIKHIHTFDTAKEMLIEMKKNPFDLILLDIELKSENGLDVCKNLKYHFKDVKVLIISTYHSNEYIINAYENKADGYLFKDSEAKEVRIAVDKIIIENGKYFDDEAVNIIFDRQEKNKQRNSGLFKELTDREFDIMKLIADGLSDIQIGKILNRSSKTIGTHRNNILKKIGGHKSIDIYNYAVKNGYHTIIQNKSGKNNIADKFQSL